MAQFCTKCGSPLGEGMKFCTACGSVQGAPSAPAAPAAGIRPPVPPAPVAAAPRPPVAAAPPVGVAPAAKSSSPVLKIILIVVGVVIFLGLISAASCVYFVYRAKQRVNQFEKQVQTTFPSRLGTREVQPVPSAPPDTTGAVPGFTPGSTPGSTPGPAIDMGDLAYPGGTPSGNSSMAAAGVKLQEYLTSDSVETVLAYYKGKLGSNAAVVQSNGTAALQAGGPGGITGISIAPDPASGKTKISVTTIAKQ